MAFQIRGSNRESSGPENGCALFWKAVALSIVTAEETPSPTKSVLVRPAKQMHAIAGASNGRLRRSLLVNPNKALWEKGDFTRIAESMRESGEALVAKLGCVV
jgi:hypothetical protein